MPGVIARHTFSMQHAGSGAYRTSQTDPPHCADDIDVSWPRAAIVLAHHIHFQGEMFVEGVTAAH